MLDFQLAIAIMYCSTNSHKYFFESFQYNSLDTSFLSRFIMHPFWNWCVQVDSIELWIIHVQRSYVNREFFSQFFPRWMAPNLITFIGFLLTILNFLLIGFYDYDFTAANSTGDKIIPNWVWITASINIFAAYTLGRVQTSIDLDPWTGKFLAIKS